MKRILWVIPLYLLGVLLGLSTTITHEMAHYYAGGGTGIPELTYYETNEHMLAEEVVIMMGYHEGQPVRAEVIEDRQIYIYQDAFTYALTWGMVPPGELNNGIMGSATYPLDYETIDGEKHFHTPTKENLKQMTLAPTILALTIATITTALVSWKTNKVTIVLVMMSLVETQNNIHHVTEAGWNQGLYFAYCALLALICLSRIGWIFGAYLIDKFPPPEKKPQPTTPKTFRVHPNQAKPNQASKVPPTWYFKDD